MIKFDKSKLHTGNYIKWRWTEKLQRVGFKYGAGSNHGVGLYYGRHLHTTNCQHKHYLGKPSKKKKLRNFGHCPKRGGGVSAAAKLFIDEKYGHVYRRGVGAPRPN